LNIIFDFLNESTSLLNLHCPAETQFLYYELFFELSSRSRAPIKISSNITFLLESLQKSQIILQLTKTPILFFFFWQKSNFGAISNKTNTYAITPSHEKKIAPQK